jgi:tRNA 2-thiouridine synthesizing protein D
MIFTIAVHGAPYASQANHHALQFCQAAVADGHHIARVFFYHEGVYTALNSQVPPQDEIDVQAQWQNFARQQNVELAVCIANGLKRGLLSEAERNRYEKSSATLAEPFELVGLGQLIDAIANSDRYVEFP